MVRHPLNARYTCTVSFLCVRPDPFPGSLVNVHRLFRLRRFLFVHCTRTTRRYVYPLRQHSIPETLINSPPFGLFPPPKIKAYRLLCVFFFLLDNKLKCCRNIFGENEKKKKRLRDLTGRTAVAGWQHRWEFNFCLCATVDGMRKTILSEVVLSIGGNPEVNINSKEIIIHEFDEIAFLPYFRLF